MTAPRDPRDPSLPGSDSADISAAADRAREQLHKEMEELRIGIEEMRSQPRDDGSRGVFGPGLAGRAKASFAILALTGAVAIAGVNFALQQARSPKDGSLSGPPSMRNPDAPALFAEHGTGATPSPFLADLVPALKDGIFGPDAGLEGELPAAGGPLFVVNDRVPVNGAKSPSEPGDGPGSQSPVPTAPEPIPDGPDQFAYVPPRESSGGPKAGGVRSGSNDDAREDDDDDARGGNGRGKGKGHVKGRGKGHGAGKGGGHDRDGDAGGDREGGGRAKPPSKGGGGDEGGGGPPKAKPKPKPKPTPKPEPTPTTTPTPPTESGGHDWDDDDDDWDDDDRDDRDDDDEDDDD